MQRRIGPGEVVAMFIVGMFGLGLLIFTAIGNLALLNRIYPDPQFVGFGLLALEGGTVVWTVISFLTNRRSSHFGVCLVGLGVDTLLSFTGFMYELAAKTGSSLPLNLPVIYVVGFAVVFNVAAGLCYKLIPQQPGNSIPMQGYYPPYFPMQYPQSGNSIPMYPQGQFPMYPQYPQIPMQTGGATGVPLVTQTQQEPGEPKEAEPGMTLEQVGTLLKGAANTTIGKVSNFTRRGTKGGLSRGKTNETTSESGSSPEDSQSQNDVVDEVVTVE